MWQLGFPSVTVHVSPMLFDLLLLLLLFLMRGPDQAYQRAAVVVKGAAGSGMET